MKKENYIYYNIIIFSNGNRTEWSTIQDDWVSDSKLGARLPVPLNCMAQSLITN